MNYKSLLMGISLAGLTLFSGCFTNVDGELTDQQEASQFLSSTNTWGGEGNVVVITKPDGINESKVSALAVTFSSSGSPSYTPETFRTEGALEVLSAESDATWSWAGVDNSIIDLESASTSELTSFEILESENKIRFSFEVSGSSSGRVSGLDGTYRVELSPS